MSKEYALGQIARDQANRERITNDNIAREAEIRRPARKIDIINETIQDDKERAVFLSQELKNMLSDTKYVEDLLKNLNLEDRSKTEELFSHGNTIQNNLQAMKYSFPIYKLDSSGLDELSSALSNIDVFDKNSYYDFDQEPIIDDLHLKAYNDNLKSNFEENKEELYATLSGLIDQYSE